MSVAYLSTLANIGATTLSIIFVFISAYVIYLRQRRDHYRERINSLLQRLDRLIFEWSVLREQYIPVWVPPTSKYIEILTKESWRNTPLEALKQYVEEVKRAFDKSRKEEEKIQSVTSREPIAVPAIYLETEFALNNLINAIYREFPTPPGDYELVHNIPIGVKAFVKPNFPDNRKELLEWFTRFDKFIETISKIYLYELNSILEHLGKVYKESSRNLLRSIKEAEKLLQQRFSRIDVEELIRVYRAKPSFYERFISYLFQIKYVADKARDMIARYDSYVYKRKFTTLLCLLAMALTGIALPLTLLYCDSLPAGLYGLLGILAGIGFGISSASLIWVIYKEISS